MHWNCLLSAESVVCGLISSVCKTTDDIIFQRHSLKVEIDHLLRVSNIYNTETPKPMRLQFADCQVAALWLIDAEDVEGRQSAWEASERKAREQSVLAKQQERTERQRFFARYGLTQCCRFL